MAGRLVSALNASPAVLEAFSDRSVLHQMLRFEAELANCVAKVGLIAKRHAATIAASCNADLYVPADLVPVARRNMTLTVAVVRALTTQVKSRDPEAAAYVHWGATSQDVLDTAMALQIGGVVPRLLASLHGVVRAFAKLA